MSQQSKRNILEQGRAEFAYQCAEEASRNDYKEDYKSYVKKIPMLIKTNGLGATIAFIKSKSKKRDAYDAIYEDISNWLAEKEIINNKNLKRRINLMDKGKLIMTKTKKGDFTAKIVKDSDQKNISVKTKFTDDKLNGQPVFFESEKGDIIKIVNESKETIYEKPVKAINQPTSQKVTKKLLDNSFDLTKTRLPKDTRELSIKADEVDNFLWKLNLAARYDDEKDKPKFKFFHKGRKYEIHANFEKVNLQDILKRQKNHVNALCAKYESQQFTPDWRLIIGLGQESVYETSITLHHIYGIPYIPASAIKGITRNCVISDNFGSENDALDNQEFCDIFGCSDKSWYQKAQEGQIIFFDAFPTQLNDDAVQPDVMNVHYPKYYGSGKGPPTDTQNLNSILFLTVQNTHFQFIIGIKKAQKNTEDLLEKTTEYLKNALEQHGIGAKTAVGYGYGICKIHK